MTGPQRVFKPLTYLENGFPIDELHGMALNEGNSKRPIYQIHKWWARRLGSVFRTLLISSFLPPHESYESFIGQFRNGATLKNRVICDPLMGGGTSLVEGLRLGCKVIGYDINPVAWFITKKEIDEFDEGLVDKYYSKLENSVAKQIKSFYETKCQKNHSCHSAYSIWIRRITCKDCEKTSDLFSSVVIRRKSLDNVIICPKCNDIIHTKERRRFVKCGACKSTIDKHYRVIKKGVFSCPHCGSRERVIDNIKRNGTFLPTKLIAIEYQCDECGRGYKKPDRSDLRLFRNAEKLFLKNRNKLEFPRQKIPDLEKNIDRRPVTHGFKYFYDLFNPRQLLSLSLLLKEIKKIPDKKAREFLLLTFSSCLDTNNVLCKYETNWGKISALFGMPGYHVPERYGENNLWGTGRGSFPRTYLKMKRGKKELIQAADQNAKLYCGDSTKMHKIKPNTIDAVLTDPPYFDFINYSKLADFFYVWLRLGLKNQYSWFRPPTSKRNEEILAKDTEISREQFVRRLTSVLNECHRILKKDGLLVFTFHHTKNWAWKGLRKALLDAGFVVTATPIMRSEGRTGYRKGNNISYDVCVICRKSNRYKIKAGRNTVLSDCVRTTKILKDLNQTVKPSDIFTVIMSKYIRSGDDVAERIISDTDMISEKIMVKTKIKA